LVAGVGGLGATLCQILARAGVGELHLVDDGEVALSDLQRQSLYGECDLGRSKVQVAAERLRAINAKVRVTALKERIAPGYRLPAEVALVADCLDNFASRFELYRALPGGTWFLHGGVQGDQGQLLTLVKDRSQHFEAICAGCLQPEGPIPVTPDSVFVIAGLMANELFRCLTGQPKLLDRFLVVDLVSLDLSFMEV